MKLAALTLPLLLATRSREAAAQTSPAFTPAQAPPAAAPAASGAAEGQARLIYVRASGAEACPEEAAARAAVSLRLGYDPFAAPAARPLEIIVRLERTTSGHGARIELLAPGGAPLGTRELASPSADCSDLASAVWLGVSIAIDQWKNEGSREPAPATTNKAAPGKANGMAPGTANGMAPGTGSRAAASGSVTSATPAFVRAAPGQEGGPTGAEPLRWTLALGPLIAAGTLPAPVVGLGGQLAFHRAGVSIAAEIRALPFASARGDRPGSVRAALVQGGVAVCIERWHLFGCGVVLGGPMFGEGGLVRRPSSAVTAFVSTGARVGVDLGAARGVAVRAFVELLTPATPTYLRIDGRDVWSSSSVSATLGALVAFEL